MIRKLVTVSMALSAVLLSASAFASEPNEASVRADAKTAVKWAGSAGQDAAKFASKIARRTERILASPGRTFDRGGVTVTRPAPGGGQLGNQAFIFLSKTRQSNADAVRAISGRPLPNGGTRSVSTMLALNIEPGFHQGADMINTVNVNDRVPIPGTNEFVSTYKTRQTRESVFRILPGVRIEDRSRSRSTMTRTPVPGQDDKLTGSSGGTNERTIRIGPVHWVSSHSKWGQ